MISRLAAVVWVALSLLPDSSARGQARPASGAPGPTIVPMSVGSPAPAFSLMDQFGRARSPETLRGKNGTVILFFRSADW